MHKVLQSVLKFRSSKMKVCRRLFDNLSVHRCNQDNSLQYSSLCSLIRSRSLSRHNNILVFQLTVCNNRQCKSARSNI